MSGLFGAPSPPPLPKPQAPAPMPDTESPAVKEAARRRTEASLSRGGRQSTILTSQAAPSSDYSKTTLGGTS